jgi:hypothetical protein
MWTLQQFDALSELIVETENSFYDRILKELRKDTTANGESSRDRAKELIKTELERVLTANNNLTVQLENVLGFLVVAQAPLSSHMLRELTKVESLPNVIVAVKDLLKFDEKDAYSLSHPLLREYLLSKGGLGGKRFLEYHLFGYFVIHWNNLRAIRLLIISRQPTLKAWLD